jgi:hypothetical protein
MYGCTDTKASACSHINNTEKLIIKLGTVGESSEAHTLRENKEVILRGNKKIFGKLHLHCAPTKSSD